MACFKPLDAWQLESGEVVFVERGRILRSLSLPCGQCVGCRLSRSQMWAVRCFHEAQCHALNSFITLTFDDAHYCAGLDYRVFQKFLKRARARLGAFSFYMCGEYGAEFQRPHFHACLFGVGFPDRVLLKQMPSGSNLYRSAILESLWPFGFSSVGDVTFESAAYVARYVMKKITGDRAERHYERVNAYTGEIEAVRPEFNRMSLKPAIGRRWIERYHPEVAVRDAVVMKGRRIGVPRYYDQFLVDLPSWDEQEYLRFQKQVQFAESPDSSPERLLVREQVTAARLVFKPRGDI